MTLCSVEVSATLRSEGEVMEMDPITNMCLRVSYNKQTDKAISNHNPPLLLYNSPLCPLSHTQACWIMLENFRITIFFIPKKCVIIPKEYCMLFHKLGTSEIVMTVVAI